MRMVSFVSSLLVTIGLAVILSMPIGSVPPIGPFVSPQHGFWQNAEPAKKNNAADLSFPQLEAKADVYFDERMVPHVFAGNERDAFFIQGYLHAKFRLWQMEFQTYAASGRLTEVLGVGPDSAYLNNDRNMRRLGMVSGAKRSLAEMERDPVTRSIINAYTLGVNSYIQQLTTAELPLEYRLLNYLPEKWTSLKTALFMKYMSYELTGKENDIENTNAKSMFSKRSFENMYPVFQDSIDPIIPSGTVFPPASAIVAAPLSADSLYFQWKDSFAIRQILPDKDNGSNNWVAGGSKTASGKPILCNDPHLGLNLPSLWYEMQLTTPEMNVYGASFPGAPSIVIGFNDSISWGVTNAARDVRDYYRIQFKDNSKAEYLFNKEWKRSDLVIEAYQVKGGPTFYDTVAYTIFGPVMYDNQFNGNGRVKSETGLAVSWKGNEPSNELRTFYLLDKSRNYNDYLNAIKTYKCPGQNFAFAGKSGDIAIWHQGEFPAKWAHQGDFIMPGTDSSFMWQKDIPQQENPHLLNPERGFVSSANQWPADSAYPYYLGGSYDMYRGKMINNRLTQMNAITPDDMKLLQTDNYNLFAAVALPFLLNHLKINELNSQEQQFLDMVISWNKRNDASERGITVFTVWFELLEQFIWNDEIVGSPFPVAKPEPYTLLEALIRDSSFSFIDNINTTEVETLQDMITSAFRKAVPYLSAAEKEGRLSWGKYKDTGIRHLLRLEPLSSFHLKTGGGINIINAIKQFHGPGWRMIVHLTDKTEAYGIYPGGQSGNPGSQYYDNFIDAWIDGKYFELWVMTKKDQSDKRIQYQMKFGKQ